MDNHTSERETDLSDFARPPEKPPRAGKGTFGQTNGFHHMVERRNRTRKEKKKKTKESEQASCLNRVIVIHSEDARHGEWV